MKDKLKKRQPGVQRAQRGRVVTGGCVAGAQCARHHDEQPSLRYRVSVCDKETLARK